MPEPQGPNINTITMHCQGPESKFWTLLIGRHSHGLSKIGLAVLIGFLGNAAQFVDTYRYKTALRLGVLWQGDMSCFGDAPWRFELVEMMQMRLTRLMNIRRRPFLDIWTPGTL